VAARCIDPNAVTSAHPSPRRRCRGIGEDAVEDEDAVVLRRVAAGRDHAVGRQDARGRHGAILHEFNTVAGTRRQRRGGRAVVRHQVAGRLQLPARRQHPTQPGRAGADLQINMRHIDGRRQFEQARARAGKHVAAHLLRQPGIDAHAAVVGHRQGLAAGDRARGDPAPQQVGFDSAHRMVGSHRTFRIDC
jgi:hypothetical protein